MEQAPACCPMCQRGYCWKWTGDTNEGVSIGKAVVGGVLAGGVGALLGGLSGKKKHTYTCGNCGFSKTYDLLQTEVKTDSPTMYDNQVLGNTIATGAANTEAPKTEKERLLQRQKYLLDIQSENLQLIKEATVTLAGLESALRDEEFKKGQIEIKISWSTSEEEKATLQSQLIELAGKVESFKDGVAQMKAIIEKSQKAIEEAKAEQEKNADILHPEEKLKKERIKLLGERSVLNSQTQEGKKLLERLNDYKTTLKKQFDKYKVGYVIGWCVLVCAVLGMTLLMIGGAMGGMFSSEEAEIEYLPPHVLILVLTGVLIFAVGIFILPFICFS
ncbi:MAG: hypothetical protein IJX09_04120, partial [Clostridia bacterium]|nr:hypothetical protein [Clostridia bacterium]